MMQILLDAKGLAIRLAAGVLLLCGVATAAVPASSDMHRTEQMTARLITAENGVGVSSVFLSAGLHLTLAEGWKTYWRTPGEVGFPPEIDWQGSTNLADAQFMWPAPTRFRAFGIENAGYLDEVVFPINLQLQEAGRPADLTAKVNLLLCKEICIPETFELRLDVPQGAGLDMAEADRIASYAAQIPDDGDANGVTLKAAYLSDDGASLTVSLHGSVPFETPDIFPEMGPESAFGTPDIRLSADGKQLWAQLPVLARDASAPFRITVTDAAMNTTLSNIQLTGVAPEAPYRPDTQGPDLAHLLWIIGLAFLGGIILNAMPCVLPVLSIKLTSALKAADQSPERVRRGFIVSALGVVGFMWLLALATLVARATGHSVGWGLQFQNPVFLSLMIGILLLFAVNLLGFFEITLPQSWTSTLADAETRPGYAGDFATGAFAAVLATPCSAPLLGTAVAFALAGRGVDIFLIFTSLGLGLALPYLIVAIWPGMIRRLPKPGRWMLILKTILGLLLALTAVWMLFILHGLVGTRTTILVCVLLAAATAVIVAGRSLPDRLRPALVTVLLGASVLAPLAFNPAPVGKPVSGAAWVTFDRSQIGRLVSSGQTVIVDVTADWCLTCKVNKTLVLDRDPVVTALSGEGIIAMRADWTRPDPGISRYLESYGRFGIPFNIVYGPSAPEGILLSELLTSDEVLGAISRAGPSR